MASGRIDAILFDLDGTLIDSTEDLSLAVEHAMTAVGVSLVPRGELSAMMGAPLEEMAPKLGVSADHYPDFAAAFRTFYPSHWLDHTRPFQGIPKMLDRLSRIARMAVVTTKRQEQASAICPALGFGPFFDHVQGFRDTLRHKPAPDLPLAALDALGVAPARSVMVGDSLRDIQSGKAAGCITLGVTWGCTAREKLAWERPEGIVETVAELEDALKRLASGAA